MEVSDDVTEDVTEDVTADVTEDAAPESTSALPGCIGLRGGRSAHEQQQAVTTIVAIKAMIPCRISITSSFLKTRLDTLR